MEEPTDWISSFVIAPKKNGDIRICLAPQDLNRAIKRQHYKLPTREEIMANFAGAKVFSKLDASQGFYQIKLSEENSYLTTFITPFGRYRYLRMPFGISSAPEAYHQQINEMFQGIPNVDTSMDDIIVWGDSHTAHFNSLKQVLKIANENNLKLNKDKCEIAVKELTFLGDRLTSQGVVPDDRKVSAIRNMKVPQDSKDLQRFLGMVTYLAKWIPNLSEKTALIRELTKQEVPWIWSPEIDAAFSQLKELLMNAPVLKYYDPARETKISADSSMNGLGAILLQHYGDKWCPVSYASRSVSQAEKNYANIERELLGIVFACKRFHQFIYGGTTLVETDHRPLVNLFKKSLTECPARIQRLLLRLQKYDLKVQYIPGKWLPGPDALLRAVDTKSGTSDCDQRLQDEIEAAVDTVIETLPLNDKRLEQIKKHTQEDPVMADLKRHILQGWPSSREMCSKETACFWNIRAELSVADDLILKGSKLVIPQTLRGEILSQIYVGHMGIEKCRRRAREVVYWPGINQEIETMVRKCNTCIRFSDHNNKQPLQHHEVPNRPWQKVGADLGTCGGKEYLIICDYFSLYPEVFQLRNITSTTVISKIKAAFARQGTADVLVSDNGQQFKSKEFQAFANDWSFHHVTSSPHSPKSNGLAEAAVKTIKKLLKKSMDSKEDFQLALQAYRATPLWHGVSPAHMLFNRRIKATLPIRPNLLYSTIDDFQEKIIQHKAGQDRSYNVTARNLSSLKPGDNVVLYNFNNKLWDTPGHVVKETTPRSYNIQMDNGVSVRRNRQHIKKVPVSVSTENQEHCRISSPSDTHQDKSSVQNKDSDHGEITKIIHTPVRAELRQSARIIRAPKRLIEEMQHKDNFVNT